MRPCVLLGSEPEPRLLPPSQTKPVPRATPPISCEPLRVRPNKLRAVRFVVGFDAVHRSDEPSAHVGAPVLSQPWQDLRAAASANARAEGLLHWILWLGSWAAVGQCLWL